MKKLNLLSILVASIALLVLQSCSSGTSFFIQLFEDDGIKAGFIECDDCLASTMVEVEGVDGVDFVHGGTCPQYADAFGVAIAGGSKLEGLWPYSLACTDEDGLATLNTPCADVTEDCKTNDEFYVIVAVDNGDNGAGGEFPCCEVLSYDTAADALEFFTVD